MGLNNQQKGGSRSQKKSSDTKKIPSAIRWDFFYFAGKIDGKRRNFFEIFTKKNSTFAEIFAIYDENYLASS